MRRFASVFSIALLLFFHPMELDAFRFSEIGINALKGYEVVYRETGKGLSFALIGKSLLRGRTKRERDVAELKTDLPIRKAFLIWSGETRGRNPNAKRVGFVTPGGKVRSITADRIWERNSAGVIYAAVADVSRFVIAGGRYGVDNLRSDPLHPYGKDPYSVAGWALVVFIQNGNSNATHTVLLAAGLDLVRPGELYEIPLADGLSQGANAPQLIGIIGGHGRSGNGSGNLLNGKSLSGGDDWDGSSGKFWDADVYALNENYLPKRRDALTLTIDPLLQWLYPVGFALQVKSVQ